MKIKQYGRVLLADGNKASIVEIFDNGKAFLADIDKNGDTEIDWIKPESIVKVIS